MERVLFVNLTQHRLTDEQIQKAKQEFGVTNFIDASTLCLKLNVDPEADTATVKQQAKEIVEALISHINAQHALIITGEPPLKRVVVHVGGQFLLMFNVVRDLLEIAKTLDHCELIIVESTSKRESVEVQQPDGSVVKKSVFKFVRFRPIF